MDFMHISGQKEAIWNTFFSINWFGHGILKNQIQALSRTMSVFKDFPGLENLEKNSRTFKDLQEPCCQHSAHCQHSHNTLNTTHATSNAYKIQ